MNSRRPCPCCGHLVFDIEDNWPGSHEICPVCFWEDDRVQLRWPFTPGGANRVSLVEAQRNFRAYGASEERRRRSVRPAAEDEPLDEAWRPVDPSADRFEEWDGGRGRPWPEDGTVLCWWLPSFWGCPEEPDEPVAERVVIDVGSVRDVRGLHAVLKRELGFPSFYGMNWDAFWDAVTGLVMIPRELVFTGWAELEGTTPVGASELRRLLRQYEAWSPGFRVSYGL